MLKIGFLVIFRIYKITWRYVGVADLMNIVLAVVVAQMALLLKECRDFLNQDGPGRCL